MTAKIGRISCNASLQTRSRLHSDVHSRRTYRLNLAGRILYNLIWVSEVECEALRGKKDKSLESIYRKVSERAFGPRNFVKIGQSQYTQRLGAVRSKKQWISLPLKKRLKNSSVVAKPTCVYLPMSFVSEERGTHFFERLLFHMRFVGGAHAPYDDTL